MPTKSVSTSTAPRFVGEGLRSEVVKLDWPLEFAGKVYDAITVRRPTAGEVRTFHEQAEAWKSGDPIPRLPLYDVPPEVIEALDDDDDLRLGEVVQRFLPQRFRAALAQQRSPASGGASSPASPTLSDGP
jgi:hypothetical protein